MVGRLNKADRKSFWLGEKFIFSNASKPEQGHMHEVKTIRTGVSASVLITEVEGPVPAFMS